MTTMATRYLYLTRHGEAVSDESGLSENGRQQARLLGRRLRGRPISMIHHGPLPRAAQTAVLIQEEMDGVPLEMSLAAGDYVPYLPQQSELPSDSVPFLASFLDQFTKEDGEHGALLAQQALETFSGSVAGEEERHELLVTHNYLIGWLVSHAMVAPKWRWIGLNHGNAALTVIRYAPGRLPSLLIYNDVQHLPPELQWTGFPPTIRV
ncbi:MAG: histidine phosphatase family protein [Ktedonobacterales bacterium]|nr:histidine phosphatase family protein [Ktedonobacterales bacterium]